MKTKFLLVFIFACGLLNAQDLFKIVDNGKIGYINNKGQVILPPIYRSGTNFVNGTAAVRQDGYFGLIDTLGNYILRPEYDFIYQPVKGYTAYIKNNCRFLIDKNGKEVFRGPIESATIEDSTITISTKSGNYCIYSTLTNSMLTDTVFKSIGSFKKHVAVASVTAGPNNKNQPCVIDVTGNYIVKPGIYKTINAYSDGIAVVELHNGQAGAIDTKGNLLFTKPNTLKSGGYIKDKFYNGYAVVMFEKTLKKDKPGKYIYPYYEDYIDTKGNLMFNDTIYADVANFSCNRAFVRVNNTRGKHRLIDNHFKFVTDSLFGNVTDQGFVEGYALVEGTDGWGVIDTLGNYVVAPQFYEIDENTGIVGGYFFYRNDTDEDIDLYGIASVTKGVIVGPILESYNVEGFKNGLLKAYSNNRLTYIDKQGNIIWQEKILPKNSSLRPVNIDFMMQGYLHAYDTTTKRSNGWGESDNFPKPVPKGKFERNKLTAFIDSKTPAVFEENFKGLKFYIANTTKDSVQFPAQDSRLSIKIQAQDTDGAWKDIEYLPSSWCGNSYHTLTLAPYEYWQFTIPQYEGAIKTRLRAQISYGPGKEKQLLYSNTIEASINPAQFFNQIKYTASNIMDPYSD